MRKNCELRIKENGKRNGNPRKSLPEPGKITVKKCCVKIAWESEQKRRARSASRRKQLQARRHMGEKKEEGKKDQTLSETAGARSYRTVKSAM